MMLQWIKDRFSSHKAPPKEGSEQPKRITFFSPLTGTFVPLREVPDPTFAQKLVGDGGAILPTESLVVAPAAATIFSIPKTQHAMALKTDEGIEFFIHVGIDTVKLGGKGFHLLVEPGDRVEANTPLIELDLIYLTKTAPSMISPLVITNLKPDQKLSSCVPAGSVVTRGVTPILSITLP